MMSNGGALSHFGEESSQFEGQNMVEDSDDGFSDSQNRFKKIKEVFLFILVQLVIVALVLSIVAFIKIKGNEGLTYDSVVGKTMRNLVVTDDGLAVRIAPEECDSEYCGDTSVSIYCEEKGSLTTFQGKDGGDLFCVCDGHIWGCSLTGNFCKSNPILPSGGQFLPGKSCINTASSKTCPFTCSESRVPSGDFTCTDGLWDTQYCACSSSELKTALDQQDVFGVTKTESCGLTKSGDTCDTWTCEGDLRQAYDAEIRCGNDGWEFGSHALCVCHSNLLFTTLAMKGIDFVDVTECDDTPAGEVCDQRTWFCPYGLHQQGQFECDKKDGRWIVPDYPCVCSEDSAADKIPGFDRSCGYLSVGQSCDYNRWSCEAPLIPITSLECTPDGLKGECGCSVEELEMSSPLPSSDADISGCDKTPINEKCTDWTCRTLNKLCCNSPLCTEDGTWTVKENMCGVQTGALDCIGTDLSDYNPLCDISAEFQADDTCQITCNTSSSDSPFVCPMRIETCQATCRSNGMWDVPCVCNPSTLSKNIPFANSSEECQIGHKCTVSCPEEIVATVVCDPWIGYTGDCGCPALGEVIGCATEAECGGFDPWGCENYAIGKACAPSDYCIDGLKSVIGYAFFGDDGNLFCSGKSGWVYINGTDITDPIVPPSLCGCETEPADMCENVIGGTGGCTDLDNTVIPDGDNCTFRSVGAIPYPEPQFCGFQCSFISVYTGGTLECSPNGTISCQVGDACNCCACNTTLCVTAGDALCGLADTCETIATTDATTGCPSGTVFMGTCQSFGGPFFCNAAAPDL